MVTLALIHNFMLEVILGASEAVLQKKLLLIK